MNLLNFNIDKNHCGIIDFDNRFYDLHNNFDLDSLKYDFKKRYLEIKWIQSKGDWVKSDEAKSIQMNFIDVSFFKAKELDQESIDEFKEDDLTLLVIGYSTKDSNMEEFLPYNENNSDDYPIFIQSQNGQSFLILSNSVEIIIK